MRIGANLRGPLAVGEPSYRTPGNADSYDALADGQQSTILDWKRAYNQVTLVEVSREIATINTHRGLFRYRSLQFGVSFSPYHFSIHNLYPQTCAYLGDIFDKGSNRTEASSSTA